MNDTFRPARPREALEHLAAVRVAKELFLTVWYEEAAQAMFDREGQELLEKIARETEEERDDALSVMREWAHTITQAGGEHAAELDEAVRVMRRDFIDTLTEAKFASAEAFEKAALLAPRPFKKHLLELAAVDTRHAAWLRELATNELLAHSNLLEMEEARGAHPPGGGPG